MRYVTVTAAQPGKRQAFNATFHSDDPTEPLYQFARLLAKQAAPGDTFGAETARKLHEAIDPLASGLVWDAAVTRGFEGLA